MKRPVLILVLSICISSFSMADRWLPIEKTEFYSENREYMLRIRPDEERLTRPGHCAATLYQGKKKIWSRNLINNYAPHRVFVSNSGKYVVTTDDWGAVGDTPIVIYGGSGRLIVVHSLLSLDLIKNIYQITTSRSGAWWDESSITFFCQDDEFLCVRLKWGEMLFIRTDCGSVIGRMGSPLNGGWRIGEDAYEKLTKMAHEKANKMIIDMLSSTDPKKRETAALFCGQEKLVETAPVLRKMLADRASYVTRRLGGIVRVYYIREAARDALVKMGHKIEGVMILEEIAEED